MNFRRKKRLLFLQQYKFSNQKLEEEEKKEKEKKINYKPRGTLFQELTKKNDPKERIPNVSPGISWE